MEHAAAFGLQLEVEAVEVFEFENGAIGRAKHTDGNTVRPAGDGLFEGPGQQVRKRPGFFRIFTANNDTGHAVVRRVRVLSADGEFLQGERFVKVLGRQGDAGMFGSERLDENVAPFVTTPGSPGNLCQQLKGAFGRTEVRHVETDVGIDNADQRNVREVESLGDHLRAEQDVNRSGTERVEHALMAARLGHRVRIHASTDVIRKLLFDFLLEFFSAEPLVFDGGFVALRAWADRRRLEAAMMADECVLAAVKRQAKIAVGTLCNETAAGAEWS